MSAKARPPGSIDLDFVAVPRSTAVAVELDGEMVVYEETIGSVHVFDRIATIIWSCLDGTSRLRDISADLTDAFKAETATIERDVLGFVQEIGRQGLLEHIEPDPAVVEAHRLQNAGPGEEEC